MRIFPDKKRDPAGFQTPQLNFSQNGVAPVQDLSGHLNQLNAILSLQTLLQPLDRKRTPSVIGSAIGRPYLALFRIHAQLGVLNRLILNWLGLNRVIVVLSSQTPFGLSSDVRGRRREALMLGGCESRTSQRVNRRTRKLSGIKKQ